MKAVFGTLTDTDFEVVRQDVIKWLLAFYVTMEIRNTSGTSGSEKIERLRLTHWYTNILLSI